MDSKVAKLRAQAESYRLVANKLEKEAEALEKEERVGWWVYHLPSLFNQEPVWTPAHYLGTKIVSSGQCLNGHYATGKGGCVVIWADGEKFTR